MILGDLTFVSWIMVLVSLLSLLQTTEASADASPTFSPQVRKSSFSSRRRSLLTFLRADSHLSVLCSDFFRIKCETLLRQDRSHRANLLAARTASRMATVRIDGQSEGEAGVRERLKRKITGLISLVSTSDLTEYSAGGKHGAGRTTRLADTKLMLPRFRWH